MRNTRSRKSKSNSNEEDKPDASSQEQEMEVSQGTEGMQEEDKRDADTVKELCPACPVDSKANELTDDNSTEWVQCGACKTWYHWRCAGNGQELENIDKWFCSTCLSADRKRVITLKPPARKSSRKKPQHDYANLHAEGSSNGRVRTDSEEWLTTLESRATAGDPFPRMQGEELTLEWLSNNENALTEPILFEKPEGLGMEMPEPSLTVADIANIVGGDTPVEVMDVATQTNTPGYTMSKWAEYYHTEQSKRDKIRNVISLEVSDTPLGDQITPPRIVRELDWVEKYWPASKKGKGHSYPKVQLYCLMSVAKSWTDWHIDFAGSSVYYHIFRGSKVFYFITPTAANLAAYERWSGTELQQSKWLGDMADKVYKVELTQGNTMLIPTGWIHAVYTPEDSLVFGGNFLHSFGIPGQLRVREIEIATHVPKKFRFPYFCKLCWYVADHFVHALKAKEEFSPRALNSMRALANFLVGEARIIERPAGRGAGAEAAKKEAKEQVPGEKVRDAPALARELRWRVNVALNGESGDEGASGSHGPNGTNLKGKGVKRKLSETPDAEGFSQTMSVRFKNFKPKVWDAQETSSKEESLVMQSSHRPPGGDDAEWTKQWLGGSTALKDENDDSMAVDDEKSKAKVRKVKSVLSRVRRTPAGLEKQHIVREVEHWEWDT
ncbi:Clavaminate synthase-like protein [Schizopora paradoxa]|uniref:JmjC domain-containing histone demethylation protein 1 n=1 Tax=Schizopora paradoxa TaxID=27342 RepID=A0A0H2RM95_9AGAM|nr:Clavaminate synthase-like protein [Schizopora paradoxa]